MKKLTIFSAAALFSAASLAHTHNSHNWDAYQTLADDINNTVATAPLEDLAKKSEKLTKLSTMLLPAFMKKHEICTDYLKAALSAADSLTSLSLDDIEKDYHADGKLPPVKSASCYHAKDLLVHPATMAVIAKTKADSKETREQIEHELEEVLEHFSQVKVAAGL